MSEYVICDKCGHERLQAICPTCDANERELAPASGSASVETHPVQGPRDPKRMRVPKVVAMRAYEVYCAEYGPQDELVTGWCRGGFGVSELVAFLYARSFPKEEWHTRVREAFKGMDNL